VITQLELASPATPSAIYWVKHNPHIDGVLTVGKEIQLLEIIGKYIIKTVYVSVSDNASLPPARMGSILHLD
jgi:hypothetical protein